MRFSSAVIFLTNYASNMIQKVTGTIKYSKIIPLMGKYVIGSSKPYDYLVKSIHEFYSQDELNDLIKKNGFYNVEYRNLSNGISAIHSGWKI